MTRSTNMEHVEVLRDLSEVCRAAIKAGDWKVDGACDPDAVLRRADAAIASLSAPQPPAEAQAVAWEWEYIGGDHYPRGHKVARSLREMDPTNPPYPETWRPTRPLIYGDTAPPSAPEAQPVEPMTGNLLPCPFCGAPAERIDFGPGDAENEGGSCIACTRCQASGPVEFGRKESFITNWNHRITPPSAPVGVEGLPERWRREAPQAGVDSGEDAARAYREAMHWCAFQLEESLTQQPAAVDGADAQDAEIEALRVRADAMAGEAIKHEARAERLAEALHKLEDSCEDSDGVQYGTLGTAFVRGICKDALLRDHDQEGKDG